MKPELNFEAMYPRCSHRDAAGRQCRTPITDPRSSLCSYHFNQRAQKQADLTDVYAPLIRNSQGLQTAQGINLSLTNLYQLLARNLISPRRAAVLAYINSLLLRTLPAIDADLAAGITDPTQPPATLTQGPAPSEAAVQHENPRPSEPSAQTECPPLREEPAHNAAPAPNPASKSCAKTRTESASPSIRNSPSAIPPSIPDPAPGMKPS